MVAFVVLGLGFGDEGKGTTTEYLARKHRASLVVRYNGGAQAAHNIVLADGRQHTFAQFGSATLSGVPTYLSEYMLVNPLTFLTEASHLEQLGVKDPCSMVSVNRYARITNPFQVAANRLKENHRGKARHGSCGMGIGETIADSIITDPITVGDIENTRVLRNKLIASQDLKQKECQSLLTEDSNEALFLKDYYAIGVTVDLFQKFYKNVRIVDGEYLNKSLQNSNVVFEGAQGVLLDEKYGFQPYATWTNTTSHNALSLIGKSVETQVVGVIRSYLSRHGAGPFVTEDLELDLTEDHNQWSIWQRQFRVGYFDLPAFRYAVEATFGIDQVMVTHMDRLPKNLKMCVGYTPTFDLQENLLDLNYDQRVDFTRRLSQVMPTYKTVSSTAECLERISEAANAKVTMLSYGPTYEDKRGIK